MNNAEFREEKRKRYNKHLTNSGVFWAFNKEQFEEGKKAHPLDEGEKYVDIGMGGFIRKSQFNAFLKGMVEIKKWIKLEAMKIKHNKEEAEKAILYELNNHEAFYTGSIDDAFEDLKEDGYTKSEVLDVYKKHNTA